VKAINQAPSRIEKGFAIQHEFNAGAAHELHTRLSVSRSWAEALPDKFVANEL